MPDEHLPGRAPQAAPASTRVALAAGVGVAIAAAALAWGAELVLGQAPSLWAMHTSPLAWIVDLGAIGLGGAVYLWGTRGGSGPVEPRAAPVDRTAVAVQEQALDGVVAVSGSGVITHANPAALKIFGVTDAQITGQPLAMLIPEHAASLSAAGALRRTARGEELGEEWTVEGRHGDGTRFPLEVTRVELGRARAYSVRDISERRAREAQMREVNQVLKQLRDEALDANRSKSVFLANMSHELRTPLNAILGYSEMLKEEIEDLGQDGLADDLTKINTAGRHLLMLINSILDLSKIEAGKMELFMELADVRQTVAEVEELARPLAAHRGNALKVHVGEQVGRLVTDMTKLRQILLNLLSNACKFTEGGTVTLEADREEVEGVDWVVFRVRDTGIGMDEGTVEKLFEEFTQADASTTRKFGGTGLGLAISRRFCHMMGGGVSVRSTLHQGSEFTVRLPANTTLDPETTALPSGAPDGIKVLVIDDDAGVRELLARTLAREGFHVQTAGGGREGLSHARRFEPDVITLDVMMPGMDGWSVLSALKNDSELSEVPVVMVSMVDERRVGYALGAAAYLTKPIDRRQLVHVLQGLLGEGQSPFEILLVEDEAAVRELVRRTLETDGWRVTEARNGREALRCLEDSVPAAVLLDLMMPEMDGFQFITELDRHPEWCDVPVVVITAMDLDRDQRRRLERRVDRILQKGAYSRDELIDIVRAKVRHHAARVARVVDASDPSAQETV